MSTRRVLLQCSGDFEFATHRVDIILIWSFLTTFCSHSWVQYREVLFKNYMYLKTTGAWSRSRVRRKTLSCPEAQGRVLFLQSWSVDWKSEEILIFTVLWDRSILSKQSIMLFIYCVIIPMKSCDCYSIIFAMSVTDKSWLNLNLKVVLRMLLRMCLNLSFFFLNNKVEISSEHFIIAWFSTYWRDINLIV